jgi:membrane associated rhomboid family serine protease
MTPSPVGMRCPECVKDRQKVVTSQQIREGDSGIQGAWREMPVTVVLIAINLVVFVAEIIGGSGLAGFGAGGSYGTVLEHGMFYGPAIAAGDWWRVLTAGFLHLGFLHIAMNMFTLYIIGRIVEPALGSAQYVAVYITALLGGSLGAMILDPETPSAGASGAIFGLMGIALVIAWSRGIKDAYQQIGGLIIVNLLITFGVSGISKGAHLGGLIGGALCGLILFELGEKRGLLGGNKAVGTGLVVAVGVGVFVANILLARHQYPQFVGL